MEFFSLERENEKTNSISVPYPWVMRNCESIYGWYLLSFIGLSQTEAKILFLRIYIKNV